MNHPAKKQTIEILGTRGNVGTDLLRSVNH